MIALAARQANVLEVTTSVAHVTAVATRFGRTPTVVGGYLYAVRRLPGLTLLYRAVAS